MPDLVRLYVRHVLIGFAIAAAFTGLLFWFDVAGLWHLVSSDPQGWIAAAMLVVANGVVFSGVQFGIAVMRMAEERDSDDDHRNRPLRAMSPILIPARSDRGRMGRVDR